MQDEAWPLGACSQMETLLVGVELDYKALWLDEAHVNGQIGCILADALAWQPSEAQLLPDALALAEVAAMRLRQLEARSAGVAQHRRPRKRYSQHLTYPMATVVN